MGRCCLLLLLLGSTCAAAAEEPLYRERFDADAGGWINGSPGDPAPICQRVVAHEGGALEGRYTVGVVGKPYIVVVPRVPSLTGARAVRFWLRTDADAMMALLLTEKGGARYITAFSSNADRWQQVEISPDRLRLDDTSTDANGKLDLDRVDGIGVLDVTGVFPLSTRKEGDHRLWIDDFRVDREEAPTAYSADGRLPYLLDDFQADYVSWIATTGSLTSDAKAGQLVWRYDTVPAKRGFTALLTILGPLPAEAGSLVLTLASKSTRRFIVALQEENRGGRPERSFHSMVTIDGADQEQTLALPLAKFQMDDKDRAKGTGPLRLDLVNRLVLVDLDVMADKAEGENTLRLSEVLLTQ